jgi:hypothetical protein
LNRFLAEAPAPLDRSSHGFWRNASMESETQMILSLLISSIGIGILIYGKKQKKIVAMIAGLALCSFPYFVSNVFLMLGIGTVLVILPFVVRE